MPIGLGIGVSHAPGMYASTAEQWDAMWHRLSLDRGIPQPQSVYAETGDKLKDMMRRIKEGHAELKRQLDAYQPDVLIIIGGDQVEMFDRSNVPQFMVFLGEHAAGPRPAQLNDDRPLDLQVDVEFSRGLLNRLVKEEGFDVAFSSEMESFGRRPGLPHAFINPAAVLLDEDAMPKTCLIYENTYDPPSHSAERAYEFGRAIARLVKDDPRRIAILGSGGLSHDPGGKRSGWVDTPLDHWFLGKLAEGKGRATAAMFSFDSDTMIGGTGENRAWITVAGAMEEMGSRATVVDFIGAGKTVTGLGIAYWPTTQTATVAGR